MAEHLKNSGGEIDAYELYALKALDEPAHQEIAAHLAAKCDECLKSLAQAERRLAALALAAPATSPSDEAGERLLRQLRVEARAEATAASITPRPRRPLPLLQWAFGGLTLALFVLCVVMFGEMRGVQQRQVKLLVDIGRGQQQLRDALEQNRELRAAASIMSAEGSQVLPVGAAPNAPSGRAFLNPQQGVVLVTSHLPAVNAGHIYELWLLPRQGKPIPAGTFQTGADGSAVHAFAKPFQDVSGIAVSVEPEAGSEQPTGPIVIMAKVTP